MSGWRVPLTDIAMPEEDVQAVLECLESGWLTMGPRTQAFEEALARYVGSPHAVTVSSGTAALHLSCLAAGIGPGDEVIVPGFTFVASASAARYVGAEPVLCDVRSAHDFNIDPDDVARRITPRTRAVVAVHFCGYPADVAALRELCDAHGLAADRGLRAGDRRPHRRRRTPGRHGRGAGRVQLLLQEAAVRRRGRHGHDRRSRSSPSACGCCAPTRMTSSTWDRHRGHDPAYDVIDVGFNFRLDEPRAALGLSRLARLEENIAARRAIVQAYRERLADVPGIELAVRRAGGRALIALRLCRAAERPRRRATASATS